jgi:chromosome partitioning protein
VDVGRLVTIANQKGGVGKTTTAINLAVALAAPSYDVLLIDLDPQGNATSGLLPADILSTVRKSQKTIYESLTDFLQLNDVIRKARDHVSVAPSGPNLVGAEIELAAVERREWRLSKLLEPVRDRYGLILIDTPPSLGLLTVNALTAADSVLIPMQCEYYALEGLSALLNTIDRVRQGLNPRLAVEGVVLTMFDARARLSHEIARDVAKHLPAEVFQAVIPRNVRLSESPSHGLSALEYDPKSVGAAAYRELATELAARIKGDPPEWTMGESADPEAAEHPQSANRKSWRLRTLFARSDARARRGA